MEEDVS
jgi:hypothetical protein